MEPELAQKLMESKDIQKFVGYCLAEMEKLNTTTDISVEILMKDSLFIATEVKARRMAYEKLEEILEPLLNVNDKKVGNFSRKEFIT